MKDPGYLPARGWYMDADGVDLEQDSQWDGVDGGDFYRDPSLEEWARPRRTLLRSPVVREDFDPTPPNPRGASPATAVRGGAKQPAAGLLRAAAGYPF